MIKECLEFNFGIAENVRVRRTTGGILGKEFRKNAVLVFFGKVHGFDIDADYVGDRRGID